jgi:hypothetical protein
MLQSTFAPDCANELDGIDATDASWPQKLIGQTPPPAASAGQYGSEVWRSGTDSTGPSPPSTGWLPATWLLHPNPESAPMSTSEGPQMLTSGGMKLLTREGAKMFASEGEKAVFKLGDYAMRGQAR